MFNDKKKHKNNKIPAVFFSGRNCEKEGKMKMNLKIFLLFFFFVLFVDFEVDPDIGGWFRHSTRFRTNCIFFFFSYISRVGAERRNGMIDDI